MIPFYYEFLNSVKIISGNKALENIPYELKQLGGKRVIVLTDPVLTKLGLVDKVLNSFKESDILVGAIYDRIPPDSSIDIVNEAAKVFREMQCDSLIAIGGGSVIDTAKGVSVLVDYGGEDLRRYMGVEILNKRRQVPFIVVPTTSGTGSEVTLVAVIADPQRQAKMEFVSYNLLPDIAVLDARMTRSLPPRVTAATGMDALAHAIEAYTCIQKNPMSDAYASAAIALIRDHLMEAVNAGHNENARLAMANASLMAGAAFSNSMVGIVHAMGHACGGIAHVPHGEAMAILLPVGMEYNLDVVGSYYADILLPLAGAEIYANTSKSERAEKAITVIREITANLKTQCGLPTSLSEVGVKQADLERIAESALHDGAIIANPKEPTYEEILLLLQEAF